MAQKNHANYIPSLKADEVESSAVTWASGNTKTVTDGQVRSTSFILIMHTSAYNGRWHITVSAGSFLITSSDAETSVTFKYRIL